jgi:hypothetical protein
MQHKFLNHQWPLFSILTLSVVTDGMGCPRTIANVFFFINLDSLALNLGRLTSDQLCNFAKIAKI